MCKIIQINNWKDFHKEVSLIKANNKNQLTEMHNETNQFKIPLQLLEMVSNATIIDEEDIAKKDNET